MHCSVYMQCSVYVRRVRIKNYGSMLLIKVCFVYLYSFLYPPFPVARSGVAIIRFNVMIPHDAGVYHQVKTVSHNQRFYASVSETTIEKY